MRVRVASCSRCHPVGEVPGRIAIPTCAGCGGMARPGTCETGCVERRLLLARASTTDALVHARASILTSVSSLRPALEELANVAVPTGGWEAGYDELRSRARAGLAQAVDNRTAAFVDDEPASPVIAWWCDRCGGLEAPQQCLGICAWRSVDWVSYDTYRDVRDRVVAELDVYRRQRSLVSRVVHTIPRPGLHRQSWLAYGGSARALLGPGPIASFPSARG